MPERSSDMTKIVGSLDKSSRRAGSKKIGLDLLLFFFTPTSVCSLALPKKSANCTGGVHTRTQSRTRPLENNKVVRLLACPVCRSSYFSRTRDKTRDTGRYKEREIAQEPWPHGLEGFPSV